MALPFGLGRQKPQHYRDMARIAWENRDQLPFAWRILRDGVCDGCALGTSGVSDWTLPGIHLCMVRLELLRLNTAPALDASILSDVGSLSPLTSTELRELGRVPVPLLRRRGEPGFLATRPSSRQNAGLGCFVECRTHSSQCRGRFILLPGAHKIQVCFFQCSQAGLHRSIASMLANATACAPLR